TFPDLICFILGLYDKCFYASCDRGWLLGIKPVSDQGNRDPRFFFSLKTDRAHKVTTITSNAPYTPNHWHHLAITYNGLHMKLYVNGAQVAVSRDQSGEIFSPLTKKCKVLMIGGNALNHNYRGTMEHLSLWRRALTQREIIRYMRGHAREHPNDLSQLVIHEDFENASRKWLTVKDGIFPQVVLSDRIWMGDLGSSTHTALLPPPCGQTICDNVEVVTNYIHFWSFRKPKTVRYRLVNVYDDYGRWPTVTEHQINLQHQHLNDAFRVYNITWERTVHNVYNSSLRNRLVLANCDISKVGDEECDPECNHTLTGFDAGYCKRQTAICHKHKQGNGVCDPECNLDTFYYDYGDCCNPNITDVTKTCFNRSSPYNLRAFLQDGMGGACLRGLTSYSMLPNELLALLWMALTSPWRVCNRAMPFESGFSEPGGSAIGTCLPGPNLPVLEAWQQASSGSSPTDPCYSANPRVSHITQLSHQYPVRHQDTGVPGGNRYSPGCVPSGPPDVEQVCEPSVRTWSPNAGLDSGSVGSASCPLQGCMLQLDFTYPLVPDSLTVWVTFFSPEENGLAAIHNILLLTLSGNNMSLGPQSVFCDTPLTLKLEVDEEVYAVQFFTMEQHLEIDATLMSSKPGNILCQECQPLRYRLTRDPPFSHAPHGVVLMEPRRYIDRFTEDAMIKYIRDAFIPPCGAKEHGSFNKAPLLRDVEPGETYTYHVQTVSRTAESEPSPPLVHQLGSPYCGDGLIQKYLGEQCDDKNFANGDGCSNQCKKEPLFNCVDEPSLCYFYDGDGLCEDFERETSVRDCGLYTPSGFLDQWATGVEVSTEHRVHCPAEVAAGYPAVTKSCQSKVFDLFDGVSQYAWFPCEGTQLHSSVRHYWLKAYYAHPMVAAAVIIHLAADGTAYSDQTQANVTVHLVDTKEQIHNLGEWRLSCRNNPLVIPVSHDLSMAFYRTKAIVVSFRSALVAISGVGLRSFQYFDPITISGCQSNEIYNPMGQSCVHYSCDAIDCQKPLVHNAEMKCSSPGYFNGVRCTITCNRGYTLKIHRDDDIIKTQSESTATLTCADGKWNKQVSCEPVDCGRPDKYHVHPAVFQFSEGTTYGKRCTFQCRQPAQLIGTNNVLTCMEDGMWSFPEALCELRCPAPPPVPNAILQTKRCNVTGLKVGSFCKYKCKPGYHVPSADKPKRRAFTRQCTEDGSWQPGVCVPVMCEPPPPVFHGSYQCTNGFQFNSECWLNCPGANHTVRVHIRCKQAASTTSVIRCRKDGNWTGSFQLCPELKGQCSLPPNLGPTILTSCTDGLHSIGLYNWFTRVDCELACNDTGGSLVLLPRNMTGDDLMKDHWRNPPKIKSIVCTMGLKWYPSPDTLHCIKGCEPFMGDNYCDGVNNRAFCNYDGGDCCHSTVKTKKVIPFPMTCDTREDCSCRDPNAQENSKGLRHHMLG
ncbi:hypothetical protein NFI96_021630, partial [Prochilodus magdalenae]